MYVFFLSIHNILRWVAFLAGLAIAIKSIVGWVRKGEWRIIDDRLGLVFTVGMYVQIVLGVIIYFFLSPLTKIAFQDMETAMGNVGLRFFVLDHTLLSTLALALAHVGLAQTRNATTSMDKFKKGAIFYTLAMIILAVSIPWYRPLFRLG